MVEGARRWVLHARQLFARLNPDPFCSVWDAASKAAQLELLKKVLEASERCEIPLFLFWGTLLGHVRENGMLPWDDDVDVAFFDPSEAYTHRLSTALHQDGLRTHEHFPAGYRTLKVYDPKNKTRTGQIWNWPYVDIYPFSAEAPETENFEDAWPVPRDLILPGRPTRFEGLPCWEPEFPLAVLDRQYPDWRTCEKSAAWDHKRERGIEGVYSRPIVTAPNGRRIANPSSINSSPQEPLKEGYPDR